MAQYRAIKSGMGFKVGEIHTFNEPLLAEFKDKFEPYSGDDKSVEELQKEQNEQGGGPNFGPKTGIINPDRNSMKARATELGINFASNVPTDRLVELIAEAEAKRGDGGQGSEGSRGDEKEEGDGEGGEGGEGGSGNNEE